MEDEIPKERLGTPSLLKALLDEEVRLQTKYAGQPIQNRVEARRDAMSYAGHLVGWYTVAPYLESEIGRGEFSNIKQLSDLESATKGVFSGDWNPMKNLFQKFAKESLEAGGEEPDQDQITRSQTFTNIANSI